ncbi:hypothetical protein [Gaopeijia maritima]|uniref:Addiction module antitoxin n=1 Tax=Gaopeijia maritima TaxID=3119007 RepID=A0ABU9E4D2_9BACT
MPVRASPRGQSLQEFLLGQLVELASGPDAAEWMARVRAEKAAMPTRPDSDEIVQLIREERDGRR